MTTTTTSTTKLLCPECQHENEPERVYCHDCGARLDRSKVRIKKEPIQDTHKRVRRMFDPTRAKIKALGVSLVRVLFGAGLVALLLDMVLPPELPNPKKDALVSGLRFDLETMATKRQPPQLEVTEDQANGFMASAVKSKHSSLDKPMLEFRRALVAIHEQRCDFITERAFMGYWSLYLTCFYQPELKDGHLSAKIIGARIGRLPIHPKLAQNIGPLVADALGTIGNDLKHVSKLRSVELHEKRAVLMAP
jgi:hypothetical protein